MVTEHAPGPHPVLSRRDPDAEPRGVVLMLHGGAPHGSRAVDKRSGSYRRTAAMRNSLLSRFHQQDLAVCLLRFGVRGWNAGHPGGPSPVTDARWSLDEVRAAYPGAPVVLLGHSMGARTSVHVADDPAVRGVVALAPWLETSDPVDTLAGKRLVAAHGSRDKITSARRTRTFVERANQAGAEGRFVDMGRLGHYMLYRPRAWNQVAFEATIDCLG